MKKIFLEAVKILNEEFDIIPVLYGSYCLELMMEEEFSADDVDLLIPEEFFSHRYSLINKFTLNGFEYIENEVICFVKNDIEVELAKKDTWLNYCKTNSKDLVLVEEQGTKYYLLDLYSLSNLYQFLFSIRNRSSSKKAKDLMKIQKIQDKLENKND